MDPFGRLRVWRACFAAAGRLPPRALGGRRGMAVRFDADSEEVSDTIEKHLDRSGSSPQQVSPLSIKREALSLYRDVLRYSKLFVWKNEGGQEWGELLRRSAREEFEVARHERDPELIARMLMTGRESVEEIKKKFLQRRESIIEEEANLPPEQRGGPGSGSFSP